MRTVGKKWTETIKKLVKEQQLKGIQNAGDIQDIVLNILPCKILDTWEGAYSEIQSIIWDEVFKPSN